MEDSVRNMNLDDDDDNRNPFADDGGGQNFGQGNIDDASQSGSGSGSQSQSQSQSGSASESGGSQSGSGSGSRDSHEDGFGDDDGMFGVDNFHKDVDHSESHGSMFHDEGPGTVDQSLALSQPYRDNPEYEYQDGNEGRNLDNAEGDLPDPEDHRAATGASRDQSSRSMKMIMLIVCLFCVGVGAGLIVVFLIQGGDDNPSPRATTISPTAQPSSNRANVFDPETRQPSLAPSTQLPTALPTPLPSSNAPTPNITSATDVPTLAPNNTTNVTDPTSNTTVPTLSPGNATAEPTLADNATFVPTLAENSTLVPTPSLDNTTDTNTTTMSPTPTNTTESNVTELLEANALPTVAPFAIGTIETPTTMPTDDDEEV